MNASLAPKRRGPDKCPGTRQRSCSRRLGALTHWQGPSSSSCWTRNNTPALTDKAGDRLGTCMTYASALIKGSRRLSLNLPEGPSLASWNNWKIRCDSTSRPSRCAATIAPEDQMKASLVPK